MEIGKALEGELQGRRNATLKQNTDPENFPERSTPKGDTRDLAAKAAGFGNGKTYEQAKPRVHTQFLTPLRHNPAQPRRPRA